MSRRPFLIALPLLLPLAACGVEAGSGAHAGGTSTTTSSASPSTSFGAPSTTEAEPPAERNDADEVLSKAVATTTGLQVFRTEADARLEIMGQDLTLGGSGALDFTKRVGTFQTGVRSPSNDLDVEIRADGKTLWLKPEAAEIDLPPGKTWVATTTEWLDEDHAFGARSLLGVVMALEGSAGAETGSTKTIDGVPSTEYTTTVNYEDAVVALGPDASVFRRALSLDSPEPPDLEITAWVGDDGVIRDFHLDIVDDSALAFGGSYDLTVRDVGKAVPVPAAPPADATLTGPEAERIVQQILR